MAPIAIKSVLISESVDPRCRSILEENGIRVTEKQNMKKDELIAEIKVSSALSPRLLRYTRLQPPKLGVSSCISDQVTSFQTAASAFVHGFFVHGFDPCTVHLGSRSLLRVGALSRVNTGASAAPG